MVFSASGTASDDRHGHCQRTRERNAKRRATVPGELVVADNVPVADEGGAGVVVLVEQELEAEGTGARFAASESEGRLKRRQAVIERREEVIDRIDEMIIERRATSVAAVASSTSCLRRIDRR